jgi:hypothetical protein
MTHPGATLTYDNPRGGRYRAPERGSARLGTVERLGPKTAPLVRLDPGRKFADLGRFVVDAPDPRGGSAVVGSLKTGHVYGCANSGNRRGRLRRVARGPGRRR